MLQHFSGEWFKKKNKSKKNKKAKVHQFPKFKIHIKSSQSPATSKPWETLSFEVGELLFDTI